LKKNLIFISTFNT